MNTFPVINLGAAPRLGQNGGTNRLVGLPTSLILNRVQLPIAELNQQHVDLTGVIYFDTTFPEGYDPADVATLEAVRQNPTPDELRDLAMIDSVLLHVNLRNAYRRPQVPAAGGWGAQENPIWICEPDTGAYWTIGPMTRHPGGPFFCPPEYVGVPRGMPYYTPPYDHLSYLGLRDAADYVVKPQFGPPPSDPPWGEYKTEVRNAYIIFKALNDYPFPNPIPILPAAWYNNPDVRAGLQSLVKEPLPENEKSAITLVRMWITMMTVQTYGWVAAVIADEIESELESELRRNLVEQAVIAVGIAILTAGLGAAVALALPTVTLPGGLAVSTATAVEAFSAAVQSYYSKEEQEKAAEELNAIAAQFRPDNPAFAEEVQKVADTFEYLAGKVGTAWGLTEDQLRAVKEAKERGEISPATHGTFDTPAHELQKPSPLVPIGIGALTAGALYFLL